MCKKRMIKGCALACCPFCLPPCPAVPYSQASELVVSSIILMLQLEQEGVAVLTVQRLEFSPAGLLKLKLFQKAGNLLLQSLEVRQSSEVISLCTDTPTASDK